MHTQKEEFLKFLTWLRNGTAFCTTWFLILIIIYSSINKISAISTDTLIKLILFSVGGVLLFNLFFTRLVIKRWSFIKRLSAFMIAMSIYEYFGFHSLNFFQDAGSTIKWTLFCGIILGSYFCCIVIYQIYSKKQGEIYTKSLQAYQQQRRIENAKFREVTAGMYHQMTIPIKPKKSTFRIPEQDFFKYDPGVKNEVEYLSNAYHEYTSGYATSLVRSTSEMLFEQYCEGRDDIEWVYKNGDTGQQYFSIVYMDGIQHQWLFYADYIVMKKDGTVWVIETKGGEARGKDKNIDKQIENKFYAFKNYAEENSLHWGFVRDKDNQLYINNTEFAHDMADEHWVPLSQEF